ncbi:hypothetical protein [Hymenobacter sp. 102]|uniref:hypothetical protein n=1 Tax=Hymenobacter sp. 102 TaxID=3403152 RepID=UPI003CE9CFCD
MLLTLHDIRAQFAPEYALLRFQWQPADAAFPRFQLSMSAVAQLVEYGVVRSVVLDLHDLPPLSLSDQLWLATQWLGRVSVPAVERVALVLPASNVYNNMVVESLLYAGRTFIRYEVQFFSNVAGALDWMLEYAPQGAQVVLEQEWETQLVALSADS